MGGIPTCGGRNRPMRLQNRFPPATVTDCSAKQQIRTLGISAAGKQVRYQQLGVLVTGRCSSATKPSRSHDFLTVPPVEWTMRSTISVPKPS